MRRHTGDATSDALPPMTAELVLIAGLTAGGTRNLRKVRRRLMAAKAFAEVLARSPGQLALRPIEDHARTRIEAAKAVAWLDAGLEALDTIAPLMSMHSD